tara:strand:+ start:989 stop:1345 length:357 start_codon:yes stop_codon:yes gene_type:complete
MALRGSRTLIDWERVKVLRDEVGAEDFDEVVALFMDEMEEVTKRLATSPALGRIEADLHFLKGSALSFGFQNFSELCQEGETRSAQGDAAQVDLSQILGSYAASKQQFLSSLAVVFPR